LLVFFDSFGDHPLPTGVTSDYTGVMKSCFASRVDEGTIRLRCRAEGPDGIVGDLDKLVRRGDPEWQAASRIVERIEIRTNGEERFATLAEARADSDDGKVVETRDGVGMWVSLSRVYPRVIIRDDGSVGV
jgi:hypothetical protein